MNWNELFEQFGSNMGFVVGSYIANAQKCVAHFLLDPITTRKMTI